MHETVGGSLEGLGQELQNVERAAEGDGRRADSEPVDGTGSVKPNATFQANGKQLGRVNFGKDKDDNPRMGG